MQYCKGAITSWLKLKILVCKKMPEAEIFLFHGMQGVICK